MPDTLATVSPWLAALVLTLILLYSARERQT